MVVDHVLNYAKILTPAQRDTIIWEAANALHANLRQPDATNVFYLAAINKQHINTEQLLTAVRTVETHQKIYGLPENDLRRGLGKPKLAITKPPRKMPFGARETTQMPPGEPETGNVHVHGGSGYFIAGPENKPHCFGCGNQSRVSVTDGTWHLYANCGSKTRGLPDFDRSTFPGGFRPPRPFGEAARPAPARGGRAMRAAGGRGRAQRAPAAQAAASNDYEDVESMHDDSYFFDSFESGFGPAQSHHAQARCRNAAIRFSALVTDPCNSNLQNLADAPVAAPHARCFSSYAAAAAHRPPTPRTIVDSGCAPHSLLSSTTQRGRKFFPAHIEVDGALNSKTLFTSFCEGVVDTRARDPFTGLVDNVRPAADPRITVPHRLPRRCAAALCLYSHGQRLENRLGQRPDDYNRQL